MNLEYYIGECKICKKITALKDGICRECAEKELPDFFKNLFNKNSENGTK